MRRAMDHFPYPHIAHRVLEQFYISGGKRPHEAFGPLPLPRVPLTDDLAELTVLANFAEVYLAKSGHHGLVGVNYLEKIQIPTLPSLYGAMLAGVDYVLMGAGVPRAIPGILDRFANGEGASLAVDVAGLAAGEQVLCEFDPQKLFGAAPRLRRPQFIAIVSSSSLAQALARKSSGQVNGFVVEGPSAGGHNAPPRGPLHLNDRGEPIYTDRDAPDLERIRELNLPFWMAGLFADPQRLAEARSLGAEGVQVGTAFAFCEESGLTPELKQRVIEAAISGQVDVVTAAQLSPTGFPFKVVQLEGTLSDAATYDSRRRGCDLGYLRSAYRQPDGTVGYRCPAEPVSQYVSKGGDVADTCGRVCLCNGLLAAIGLGKRCAEGEIEKPVLTAGEDVRHVARFLKLPSHTYSAADVLDYLLGDSSVVVPADGEVDRDREEPRPAHRSPGQQLPVLKPLSADDAQPE